MENNNTKSNNLREQLDIKFTYKELVFVEHDEFFDAYKIYMTCKDGVFKEVGEILINSDAAEGNEVVDPDGEHYYDMEVSHISNSANPIYVADYPKSGTLFENPDYLEKIRFALIAIENYLYSHSGGELAWKYEE